MFEFHRFLLCNDRSSGVDPPWISALAGAEELAKALHSDKLPRIASAAAVDS
jgi:hypothetical protein